MVGSKSFLTVGSVALALMFGGGAYVLYHMNTLAKPVVERIASKTLGVAVTIESMEIELEKKSVKVSNVRIANPPGFSKPHAVTIDLATVSLDKVERKFVGFRTINVRGTTAYLEVKPDGTNFHALQKNLEKGGGSSGSLKVAIGRLFILGTRLRPSVTLLEEQNLSPVRVADIKLQDIGTKENGVVAGEAVRQVMEPFLAALAKSAGSAGFYEGLSTDMLKEIGAGQATVIKETIDNEIDKVTDGIKTLFE